MDARLGAALFVEAPRGVFELVRAVVTGLVAGGAMDVRRAVAVDGAALVDDFNP